MSSVFANVTEVTDASFEEARAYIGHELRIEQYNHEASYDSIRHYALGIGDANPLWGDEAYAAKGIFGTMVAPPTFFVSVFPQGIAPGLTGLQPFHAGTHWTWERLARRGERIRASARLIDVQERVGHRGGRMVLQVGEALYRTEGGELLARAETNILRIARPGARSGGLGYEERGERKYTDSELSAIEAAVFAEERRGTESRLWESVRIADRLTPVVKGPLDRMAMTAYYGGAAGSEGYKACEVRWAQRRAARLAPDTVPNNHDISYLSEWVLPSQGHQDDVVARAVGMPGAYDNGPMRVGWVAHLLTNWIGDDGMLRNLSVRVVKPNRLGDTTWITGEVVRVFEDNGNGAVEVAISGQNQEQVTTTVGTAVVWLPSTKFGPVVKHA